MQEQLKPYRRAILWSSIGIMLVAFTQDSYCTSSGCGNAFIAFLLGWFSIFFTVAGVSWLANPLLILSWVTIKVNPKLSWYASIGALIFASSFMLFDEIIDNEAGHLHKIISYGLGYKLWLFSISIMFVWNFLQQQEFKKLGKTQKENPFEL
jgi:hypothetical protein